MNKDLITKCYQKSIELLLKNSTEFGILASSKSKRAVKRNYLSIFGRDASICALGMVASQDKRLKLAAKRSLKTLAKFQADNGQIPNSFNPQKNQVDFWAIGCIDATLWWLVALKFYHQYSGDKKLFINLKSQIYKALIWLSCQEHAGDYLIMQNQASDWADLMPRSGKVLYANALWHHVKELYKIKNIKETKKNFNNLFFPFDDKIRSLAKSEKTTVKAILKEKKPTQYYLSFVNYLFWGTGVDVYGNSLAILFNLPDKKLREKTVSFFLMKNKANKLPIPVLYSPIKENSRLWHKYMESHRQNFPGQYHNGGIWPFAACFWVMALYRTNRRKQAREELLIIAQANQVNNWQFNEWFHAKTGKPMGMAGQSWNAAMFVLAYHYLQGDIKI